MLRYLPPDSDPAQRQRLHDGGATLVALRRRGLDYGFLVRAELPAQHEDLAERWAADLPIHLPGVLAGGLEVFAAEIDASAAMFGRLRKGGRFLDEMELRLGDQEGFIPAGCSFDREDPREIEKVWMRAVAGETVLAEELWAKLSWIAHDEADESLRVSFSFGFEQLEEWRQKDGRIRHADAACELAFPECGCITGHVPLVEALSELLGTDLRFSERILYANAPGGGALFHHDAEPGQLGVVFGQLQGRTAWLAAPKGELAALLAELGGLAADAVPGMLDAGEDPGLGRLLNEDPRLVAALVARDRAFVLEAGDALLLPNHGMDATCWHSVFNIGRPSLGHSYGIFAAGG